MRKLPVPEFALFAMTIAWGLSFVVVPWSLASSGDMTSIALRAAVGLACLIAIKPRALAATALEWRAGTLAGLCLTGGYVLQTAGLRWAGSGKSGFLTAFSVTLVPLFEGVVYRRAPPVRDLGALLLATAGIAIMVVRPDLTISPAEGIVALAAFCWAAQIVVVGRVAQRADPIRLAAIQLLVLVAAGAGGAVCLGEPSVRWSGGFVACVLFLGVVINAFGTVLQAWAQKRVPPTRAAVLFSAEPVFAAVFGVWLAGETFGASDALGAALVMGAVALAIWLARRAEPG